LTDFHLEIRWSGVMEDNAHRWERLEELFAAAADLPRDRQDAFVEHETASDGTGIRGRPR
jgi:hypothetical protein